MSYEALAWLITIIVMIIGIILSLIFQTGWFALPGIAAIFCILMLKIQGDFDEVRASYSASNYDLDGLYASFQEDPNYECVKVTKATDKYWESRNPSKRNVSYENVIHIIDQIGPDKVEYIIYEPSEEAKKKQFEYEMSQQYKTSDDTKVSGFDVIEWLGN